MSFAGTFLLNLLSVLTGVVIFTLGFNMGRRQAKAVFEETEEGETIKKSSKPPLDKQLDNLFSYNAGLDAKRMGEEIEL